MIYIRNGVEVEIEPRLSGLSDQIDLFKYNLRDGKKTKKGTFWNPGHTAYSFAKFILDNYERSGDVLDGELIVSVRHGFHVVTKRNGKNQFTCSVYPSIHGYPLPHHTFEINARNSRRASSSAIKRYKDVIKVA